MDNASVTADTPNGAGWIFQEATDTTIFVERAEWYKESRPFLFREGLYQIGVITPKLLFSAVPNLYVIGRYRGAPMLARRPKSEGPPSSVFFLISPPCAIQSFTHVN